MLCQRCHKNEATVHIKNNINGNVTEMMLCRDCAEKENITSFFQFPSDNLFSGFFQRQYFRRRACQRAENMPALRLYPA